MFSKDDLPDNLIFIFLCLFLLIFVLLMIAADIPVMNKFFQYLNRIFSSSKYSHSNLASNLEIENFDLNKNDVIIQNPMINYPIVKQTTNSAGENPILNDLVDNQIVDKVINPTLNHLINPNLNDSEANFMEMNDVEQNFFNYLMPMNNPGLLHSMNETNYNEYINNPELDEALEKYNDLPEPEEEEEEPEEEEPEEEPEEEEPEEEEPEEEPSKRSLDISIETSVKKSKKIQKNVKSWCFVGDFKGERGCAPVGNRDKCITGQIYVDQMECLKIKPDNAPILPPAYSNYYNYSI
jgi:hypothetical protein